MVFHIETSAKPVRQPRFASIRAASLLRREKLPPGFPAYCVTIRSLLRKCLQSQKRVLGLRRFASITSSHGYALNKSRIIPTRLATTIPRRASGNCICIFSNRYFPIRQSPIDEARKVRALCIFIIYTFTIKHWRHDDSKTASGLLTINSSIALRTPGAVE